MAFNSDAGYTAYANVKPSARFTLPPASFFKFPPSEIPQTLPPPPDHPTLAHPFTIPTDLYNATLSKFVPTTTALVYITAIVYLNRVNESRNHKPWAFSQTRLFKLMVIIHNILLAVYSAWTFIGMLNTLKVSVYPPWDELGLVGTVDSLCKVNGPRGLGSAARYNETSEAWSIANRFFHLGADGLTPDVTDVGRIWNEGLAFYGWLFYLSKFYEVIDTLIIIAKGKKSSFLQTFHHAGAMLCMWAGVRYMAAPIWLFVLANSFIHAIMYTFYFFSALGVKVPVWLKRTLTTMQISQFVIGAPFAFAHLFIEYQSPISVPYLYQLSDAASTVASGVSSAAASADYAAYAKKLLLRAAGREGLAENVLNNQGRTFGVDALHPARDLVRRYETRYREELGWTHCLDTSGQTLAIYLNVLYLLPLTWLFGQFFVKSYMQRLELRRSSTVSQKAQLAIQSTRDASKGVGRRVSEAFEDSQGGIDGLDEVAIIDEEEVKSALNDVKQAAKVAKMEVGKAASGSKKGMSRALDELKGEADRVKATARNEFQVDLDKVKEKYESVKSGVDLDKVKEAYDNVKSGIVSTAQNVKKTISTDQNENGVERHEDEKSSSNDIETVTDTLQEWTGSVVESIKSAVSDVPDSDHKLEDTNGKDESANDKSHGHDDQSAADKSEQQEHSLTKPQKEDDVSIADNADDANATDDTADHTAEATEKKIEDQRTAETAEKDNSEQAQGPDQEVRQKDLDDRSNAEPSTGDAKAAKSPQDERSARDNAPQKPYEKEVGRGVHSASKPNKEKSSVEDSCKQDSPAQNVSSEEKQVKEPESRSPKDQGASWIHVEHNNDDKYIDVEKSGDRMEAAPAHAAKNGEDSGGQGATNDKSDEVKGTPESADAKLATQHEKNDETTNNELVESQAELAAGSSHRVATEEPRPGKEQPPKQGGSESQHSPNDSKHLSYAAVVAESIKDYHEQEGVAEGQGSPEAATPAKGASDTDKPEGPNKQKQYKHDNDIPKQEQDAIIADSESVRDEIQDTENTKAKDTAESEAQKKEQDEVIADSEPVRDEVKDTEVKDDTKTADVEVGA